MRVNLSTTVDRSAQVLGDRPMPNINIWCLGDSLHKNFAEYFVSP
ncbi:hypothetical protein ACVWYH_005167 [Bradyrhizobium sp. GM24.11]